MRSIGRVSLPNPIPSVRLMIRRITQPGIPDLKLLHPNAEKVSDQEFLSRRKHLPHHQQLQIFEAIQISPSEDGTESKFLMLILARGVISIASFGLSNPPVSGQCC